MVLVNSVSIPKVTLLFVFRAHCGTLESSQSKECECVMQWRI